MLISNGSAEPPETFVSTCRTISSSLTGPRLSVSRPASMRAASSSSVMSRVSRSASASTVSSMNCAAPRRTFPLRQQRRGEALDAGQRRPELVRHRRDEVRAFAVALVADTGVADAHDHSAHRSGGALAHQRRGDEVLTALGRPPGLLGDPLAGGDAVVGAGGVVPGVAVEVVERHGIAECMPIDLVAVSARADDPDPSD